MEESKNPKKRAPPTRGYNLNQRKIKGHVIQSIYANDTVLMSETRGFMYPLI
jgi:hypothetical protein